MDLLWVIFQHLEILENIIDPTILMTHPHIRFSSLYSTFLFHSIVLLSPFFSHPRRSHLSVDLLYSGHLLSHWHLIFDNINAKFIGMQYKFVSCHHLCRIKLIFSLWWFFLNSQCFCKSISQLIFHHTTILYSITQTWSFFKRNISLLVVIVCPVSSWCFHDDDIYLLSV